MLHVVTVLAGVHMGGGSWASCCVWKREMKKGELTVGCYLGRSKIQGRAAWRAWTAACKGEATGMLLGLIKLGLSGPNKLGRQHMGLQKWAEIEGPKRK